MAMGTRKQREKQEGIWIAHTELAAAPGHPFYQKLNELLEAEHFDEFVEGRCAKFYAAKYGRPSLTPGIYFRSLLIGYFEGIGVSCYITTRSESVSCATTEWLRRHDFPLSYVLSMPVAARAEGLHPVAWKAGLLEYLFPKVSGVIDDDADMISGLGSSYGGTLYLLGTRPETSLPGVIPCFWLGRSGCSDTEIFQGGFCPLTESAKATYHRFGQYSRSLDQIRLRLEHRAVERAELQRMCSALRIPGDFDVSQISWRADYDPFFYRQLSRRARRIYLFRDEYIFDVEKAVVVETPQLGHATYVFSKPRSMDSFLALYTKITKDDIRRNRDNAAERLGFLGRVIHGTNPRVWLRDIRQRVGEAIDFEIAIEV